MTDELSFRPAMSGFEEAYPRYFGGQLVMIVLRVADAINTRATNSSRAEHASRWRSVRCLLGNLLSSQNDDQGGRAGGASA